MKKTVILFAMVCIFQIPVYAAHKDSTKNNKAPGAGFEFSYGMKSAFIGFDKLNTKLFGADKNAYFDDAQFGYLFDFGYHSPYSYVQIEISGGKQQQQSDNNISTFDKRQVAFNIDGIIALRKNIDLLAGGAIGITDYTLNVNKTADVTTFDSFLNQPTVKPNMGTLNLSSTNNLFFKPQIGIVFLKRKTKIRQFSINVSMVAGYQFYPRQAEWFSSNGLLITDVPVDISGPTLELKIRFLAN